ncbi:hypothetical protein CH063_10701, partial [Colletotrichum higginsianum]
TGRRRGVASNPQLSAPTLIWLSACQRLASNRKALWLTPRRRLSTSPSPSNFGVVSRRILAVGLSLADQNGGLELIRKVATL